MSGFFTSPRIAWGPGAAEQLQGLGLRRAAVLVDPAIAGSEGPRRVREDLVAGGTEVEWIADVPATATIATVALGVGRIGVPAPDTLVAIGGGSILDIAKGIMARLARPDVELGAVSPLTDLNTPERPRLIAVPTTGGSGSEASGMAYLLAADGTTLELSHRALMPEWALVDPTFVRSVPSEVAVDAGVQVLGHALEALASAWANPFSDALARDAIGSALPALTRLARHSQDEEARTDLLYGSTRAGLAAANAQLGLAHALARALLPSTGLSYGRLFAIVLPHVVAYNFGAARERYRTLGAEILEGSGVVRVALPERLHALNELLRVPRTLPPAVARSVTASRATIVERTQRSTACISNPRIPSSGELERLLDESCGIAPRTP